MTKSSYHKTGRRIFTQEAIDLFIHLETMSTQDQRKKLLQQFEPVMKYQRASELVVVLSYIIADIIDRNVTWKEPKQPDNIDMYG